MPRKCLPRNIATSSLRSARQCCTCASGQLAVSFLPKVLGSPRGVSQRCKTIRIFRGRSRRVSFVSLANAVHMCVSAVGALFQRVLYNCMASSQHEAREDLPFLIKATRYSRNVIVFYVSIIVGIVVTIKCLMYLVFLLFARSTLANLLCTHAKYNTLIPDLDVTADSMRLACM